MPPRRIQLLACALGALAGTGCGTGEPLDAVDAGRRDDPGADGGAECHAMANTALPVETMQRAESRPDGTGGAITEGLYHRIANTAYTGPGGAIGPYGDSVAETHSYRAGELRQISWTGAGGGPGGLLTYETRGPAIRFTFTCPFAGAHPPIDSYTATADSLTLFGSTEGIGLVLEYALVQAW